MSSSGAERRRAKPATSASARERQQEIVKAATRVFAAKGYRGASVRDIGIEAGLDKSTIYYYITSKEDLLFEIASAVHDMTSDRIVDIEGAGGSAADRLAKAVRGHLAGYVQNPYRTRVYFTEYRHLSHERLGAIRARRSDYERYIASLIAEGQAEGSIDPAFDPRTAALTLLASVNALCVSFNPEGPIAIEEIVETFMRILLNGVLGTPNPALTIT